jgi:DNA-binding NarL/FixJ family response regulator
VTRPARARVAVVDGNASLAGVLAELIADEPGFAVAGVATTSEQALGLARECQVDLVLLDERLDGSVAPAVLESLREHCPSAAVVLWSHHETHTAVAGIDAVVPRGITFRELVRALRAALRARVVDARHREPAAGT